MSGLCGAFPFAFHASRDQSRRGRRIGFITGGRMAWAPDQEEQYRIAAGYVDQILKGASPGDLPIRYRARYFWTLNQAAARGLD